MVTSDVNSLALQLSYDEAREMMHQDPGRFKNLVQQR